MSHEIPRDGNPLKLTIKQHFHTAHAIEKFYGIDGKVEVRMQGSSHIEKRHSRAAIFYTKRTWDQRAETGYMASIEKAFHEEIDVIKTFNQRNHEAISEYGLLWKIRHKYHLLGSEDVSLNGISGSGLDKESEEILESNGVSFFRDGGVLPGRFVTGVKIQSEIDFELRACSDLKWGLIKAIDGEFIIADGYGNFPFMPISPKFAFWAREEDQEISRRQLADINKLSIQTAKEYCFAREFAKCPVS